VLHVGERFLVRPRNELLDDRLERLLGEVLAPHDHLGARPDDEDLLSGDEAESLSVGLLEVPYEGFDLRRHLNASARN
jgi:hypothetical protein